MEIYDYVAAEAPGKMSVRFSVPFEHKKSELRVLCCVNDKEDYAWAVYDAGVLTEVSDGVYSMECPFGDMSGLSTWKLWAWRFTSATEAVDFDEQRIPVEGILSKLKELSRKADETAEECGRALRVPEGDSAAFFPPKDVRANEIAGFDEEGRPATGRRVKQVDEVFGASEAAKEAAEEAEASAEAAAESADAAKGYADDAKESAEDADASAQRAESAASVAKDYATSAANSAQRAESAAEESEVNAEDVQDLVNEANKVLDSLLDAIEEAEESGTIINVPMATVLLAGKVKLSYADVVADDGNYGRVGFNQSGQLAIPPASSNSYGVVKLGGAFEAGEDGSVELKKMTTTTLGVGKLSTSTVLDVNASEYDKRAGLVGMNESGQLLVQSATLNRLGAVRLGSQFHPTHEVPYVVGIGASNNEGKLGQLAFNLSPIQEDDSPGSLVYDRIEGSTSTAFEMRVKDATPTQKGVVFLKGVGAENGIAASYESVGEIEDIAIELKTLLEEAKSGVQEIKDIIASMEGFRWVSFFDDEGNEKMEFLFDQSEQDVELKCCIWVAVNPLFTANLSLAVEIVEDEGNDWLTVSSTIDEVYNTGIIKFHLSENLSPVVERMAKISIRYGVFMTSAVIYQAGLGPTVDSGNSYMNAMTLNEKYTPMCIRESQDNEVINNPGEIGTINIVPEGMSTRKNNTF